MDISSTVLRDPDPNLNTEIFKRSLAEADAIVLLYDITSKQSFDRVTDEAYIYTWLCRPSTVSRGDNPPKGKKRFGCIVVGNKLDIVKRNPEKRAVSQDMAEQWASSQGFRHIEVTSKERHEVDTAMEGLVRSIDVMRERDEKDSGVSERGTSIKSRIEKGKASITDKMRTAFS